MNQFTEEQALAFFESKQWKPMTLKVRALFQLQQKRLCMPFDVFHKAVQKTVGRPVFTHEFGFNADGLLVEVQRACDAADHQAVCDALADQDRADAVAEQEQADD
jgi:hypothetical protein